MRGPLIVTKLDSWQSKTTTRHSLRGYL